ncbi:MAG: hypothetical protein IPK82_18235 [Polyangiaceae bacterium]|nr:hypothetical protein [Polyangiaceae bacterium]
MLMRRVQFGRTSGVVIDICWDHGTWFDNGELSAMIRYAAPRVHKHPQEPTEADLRQEELDGMDKRRRAFELGRSMADSAPRIAEVAKNSAKEVDTTELPFSVLRYLLGRLW